MLAKAFISILPDMTEDEIIETTKIYSAAGELVSEGAITKRPFRSPHHSASHIALIGGGKQAQPGEITLAHNGVLFLDEFPEFGKNVIEALRQPMEDNHITISRAYGSFSYPAKFLLIATKKSLPMRISSIRPKRMCLHILANNKNIRKNFRSDSGQDRYSYRSAESGIRKN